MRAPPTSFSPSFLLLLVVTTTATLTSTAAERAVVYVSASKANTLIIHDLDLDTGKRAERRRLELDGSPGAQCLSPDGETLYVSVRSAKSVAAFRRDGATGALTHIATQPIGSNAAYVSTDRSGRWLLAASYSGGVVSSHAIREDGGVGETVSSLPTTRCAHAILPDVGNRFVLVPHTCPNAVYQFRLDDETGKLSANEPELVRPTAGLEPRHLAFHPTLDVVYFDDEKGSSVTAYSYDRARGVVAPFQTVSTLPEEFTAGNSCADIEITVDGRFVYASNRGHDSIAGFSVDEKSGKLTSIGQFATGETPRSFNLSPDGRWLVAAGQKSHDLTTYRRDTTSGRLEKLTVLPTGRGPAWVQIVELEPGNAADSSVSDDWPRFRGADGTGAAKDDPRLVDRWSRAENVLWSTDIAGWGWSSPVITGNKVFVTAVVSEGDYAKPKAGLYLGRGRKEPPKGLHRWTTYCVDLDSGKVLWTQEAHRGEPRSARHPKSTYASETPATDGERLYVLFGDVGLYCYDLDGKLLWSHRVDPKKTFYDYGAAGSPVVHDGQVVMVYDNQESSYIASYNGATGEQIWRTPRDSRSTWATPFVWETQKRTEIVVPGKERILSYDMSGKVLWELAGKMSNLVIPSPFTSHGLVYITSGYVGDRHRPVYAVRPNAEGDISLAEGETSNESIAWYRPKAGPYNPSPIVHGDYYYTVHDRGFITCHDARSGKEVYGKTRLPRGSSFTSSPWAYNGKLFCLTEGGDTHVIRAGPEFELLHTNSLDELAMASPAVARGKLLIRTASKLYCIGE